MSAFRTSSVLRMAARVPGIKFPTRRLPDGTRVSDSPQVRLVEARAANIGRDPRERKTNNVPFADLLPSSI